MDNADLHPADDTLKFYVWYEWIEVYVAYALATHCLVLKNDLARLMDR